ncbi:MAG: Ig-like domain-containing protein [Polyangiaceae bacterium]|nr:Ig-like domain-containing protein [Polyangiaceae bacterium]
MKKSAWRAATLAALAALFSAAEASADGSGLPNLSYDPAEVFTVIGHLGAENGSPRGHGTLSFHRGYLTVIFSKDSGEGDGGFAFYDIADPKNPQLVFAKDDADTEDIREAHGYGYWGDYVVLQASLGIQIWNWADVTNPQMVSYLKLPGVSASDYIAGAWWAFWQAPYIYVGGSQNGLFIVDATDVSNPVVVKRDDDRPNPIPTTTLGGFRTGPVFAAGNILVASGMDDPGYAVLDIADPKNPILLSAKRLGMPKVYSALFNGGYIYGAGDDKRVHVHNITDPFKIVDGGSSDLIGDKGGYLSIQDGYAHVGASKNYAKVNVSVAGPFPVVATATSGVDGRDEDFGTVLGNLVAISDDHGNGSFLVPHQAAPDTEPPVVNFVSPPSGATGVASTARVGLTFSDQIDHRLVNSVTFVVRPVGGEALSGRYSYQTNILNFAPDEPLLPNTTYEVVVPDGGLTDLAGNPLAEPFVSYFSTGALVDNPGCKVGSLGPSEFGKEASFSAVAQVTENAAFSWDFGDGSPVVDTGAAPSAKHVYSTPGHYTVNVVVRESGTLVTTCSLSQTVHRPLTPNRPTRSSTVLLDEELHRVWVVNPDHNSVSVFDADDLTPKGEFNVGSHPHAIAKANDNTVWVSFNDGIAIFDSETGADIGKIELPRGSRPYGLAMSAEGDKAFVALQELNVVRVLNVKSRTWDGVEITGVTNPRALALTGENLLVSRFISSDARAAVFAANTAGGAANTIDLEIDESPDNESNGSGLLNYLRGMAISPDGKNAWVVAKKDNYQRGEWNNGAALTFENTVRAVLATIDLETATEVTGGRIDFNDRSLPSVVEPSPFGDYLFVAMEGSNAIEVVDAYNPHIVAGLDNVGNAPDGMALNSAGDKLYVHSFLSRSLHVIDVSNLLSGRSSVLVESASTKTVQSEVLTPEVLLGKQIFYNARDKRMSRDGYLSCAVCHLEGEHDGRTWDFTDRGEGLRNTTTLAGKRGTGNGPLHWTANFDEVQDFEHDIRNAFKGKGFLPDETFHSDARDEPLGGKKAGLSPELDAISAYLESLEQVPLSPFKNEDGSFTEEAELGKMVFMALQCQECHLGNDMTDSGNGKLHDVGTIWAGSGQRLGGELSGFDTPTLIGSWATAPYLHDGSATTLMDVFNKAEEAGDLHGEIGLLTDDQKRQLEAYLLQLDNSTPLAVEPKPADGCTCSQVDQSSNRITGATGSTLLLLAALLGIRRRQKVWFRKDSRARAPIRSVFD